jgi:protein TonB
MVEFDRTDTKTDVQISVAAPLRRAQEYKQQRMMVAAFALLLVALGFVIYRDRDFWFPDTQEAEDQPELTAPASAAPASQPATVEKKQHNSKLQPKASAPVASAPPMTATTERTVLPPLEVEVVAGDVHRIVRPGANSVRVNVQANQPPPSASTVPDNSMVSDGGEATASVSSNAAERVQMSVDTTDEVSHPVSPGYPMLARQMKVQGSVILQALISRDGAIQDLHVVSGPPILAGAAQEAVKQWHFKPHYQGSEAVETKAKITVNFTISTN